MVVPEPALAPVTPPVIAPTVQVKVLGVEADNGMVVVVPLQPFIEGRLVTTGFG